MTTRTEVLAAIVAIVVLALGLRAIDRIGYNRSLHDSALTTAEHVRRENAVLEISLAQLRAKQSALAVHADSLLERVQVADRREAAARVHAESAQLARVAAGRAIDSARTAHDSLAPLMAAAAAGDATTSALRAELAAAHESIALRDSSMATQQHVITLLTMDRDALDTQRARDAIARAQLVAALTASTPQCRLLPGIPCPSRTVSAVGGAIVTAIAVSLLRR